VVPPVDRLVDWPLAKRTASTLVRVSGSGPRAKPTEARHLVEELARLAHLAGDRVVEATGLTPQRPMMVRVVDRPTWTGITIDGMRELMTPLSRAIDARVPITGTPVTAIGSRVVGGEIGAVVSLLAPRVLGQFDPITDQLLLVAPNVSAAERSLKAPAEELRLWICLHEQAHAAQFTGVPWLRGHLLGLVESLSIATDLEPAALVARLKDVVSAERDVPALTALLANPAQRDVLSRMQSLMTLLEGHAEHVMDTAAPDLLPHLPALRRGIEDRRESPGGPMSWILRKVLGLDAKLEQYARGKVFCDEVVRRGGESALATVWESPAALPTGEELRDPMLWLKRALGADVRS
jgi:coenzyme F420 biosynthesis associated uncharacterized protein